MGDGSKGVTSRDRKVRADNLAIDKPRRLVKVREDQYFHLEEDFMRR